MKKLFSLIVCCTFVLTAYGWGQKGHDVVAAIAEANLTPTAYQKVTKLLGNHSLVYYANWMDSASHSHEYSYSKTWHYANVDEGFTYETMEQDKRGDVVTAINDIVALLKSGTLNAEQENINLRFLIHLVGDLHCPMHAGHRSDIGGNKVFVKFFGQSVKLHAMWDGRLIESAHKWSYSEWENQLNKYCTPEQKTEIAKGTTLDWFNETVAYATQIYDKAKENVDYSYDYIDYATPIIEERVLRGGIRLATLLNDIYSK